MSVTTEYMIRSAESNGGTPSAHLATALLARDLMRGDRRHHQAGYTFANALIASAEAFHLSVEGTAVAAERLHAMLVEEVAGR